MTAVCILVSFSILLSKDSAQIMDCSELELVSFVCNELFDSPGSGYVIRETEQEPKGHVVCAKGADRYDTWAAL